MNTGTHGFWDMHCHTAPDLLPRWGNTVDVARACSEAGFAGLSIFSHHATTFREAHIAEQEAPGVRVVGSVCLNRVNGGIDAGAVTIHLAAGIRLFSLPTLDANAHVGRYGAWTSLKGPLAPSPGGAGLTIINKHGGLTEQANRVLEQLAEADAVLCTGHIGTEELLALVPAAHALRLTLIINHPYFLAHPTVEFWASLPETAFVQIAAVDDRRDTRLPSLKSITTMIEALGPERCMLGSQASAPTHPLQQLLWFQNALEDSGVSKSAVDCMARRTPGGFVETFLPRSV
jgi:hypothetical protein